jgi:hypothetical protein
LHLKIPSIQHALCATRSEGTVQLVRRAASAFLCFVDTDIPNFQNHNLAVYLTRVPACEKLILNDENAAYVELECGMDGFMKGYDCHSNFEQKLPYCNLEEFVGLVVGKPAAERPNSTECTIHGYANEYRLYIGTWA